MCWSWYPKKAGCVVLKVSREESWMENKKNILRDILSRYGIPQPLRVTLCAGEYNIISKMILIVSECECRGASIRLV